MNSVSKILFFGIFFCCFAFFTQASSITISSELSLGTPKKDSLIIAYFPSGNIQLKGKRYDGKWNGIVTQYYDVDKRNNNVYKKTKYKKGVFVWEKEFNKIGKLIIYTTPKRVIKKPDCGC